MCIDSFGSKKANRGSAFRSYIKNLALYYPLGLFLPFAMNRVPPSRRRAACASLALLLSVGIETWQYIHGAGMAQLSDVVMNTVGVVIGTSAYAKSLREERRDA